MKYSLDTTNPRQTTGTRQTGWTGCRNSPVCKSNPCHQHKERLNVANKQTNKSTPAMHTTTLVAALMQTRLMQTPALGLDHR